MKVIELFSGIGAPVMALKANDISFESIGTSEINKLAAQAYDFIHGETINFGDITKINELPECDFLHSSSPCTSFSQSGKRTGLAGESGLILEQHRLMEDYFIRGKIPKFFSYENVPEIKTMFPEVYEDFIDKMNKWGYNTYDTILCSKYYNNPTNRKRFFLIGIRKDIDDGSFTMPANTTKTELRIKDFLKDGYDSLEISGYTFHPRIKKRTDDGQMIGWLELGVAHRTQSNTVFSVDDLCPTITTSSRYYIEAHKDRYRCLQNDELWEIMGFNDYDFDKIKDKFSRTCLTKLIGNSIPLGPLVAIYKNLKPLILKNCY